MPAAESDVATLKDNPVDARNPLDHDGREGIFYIHKLKKIQNAYLHSMLCILYCNYIKSIECN